MIGLKDKKTMIRKISPLLLLIPLTAGAQTLVCGSKHRTNEIVLTKASTYSSQSAGFDFNTPPEAIDEGSCSSSRTMFLSFPLPEGNYTVTVDLGGAAASQTTVRAEARRLMLYRVSTAAGKTHSGTFQVALRRPEIAGGDSVRRKPREMDSLSWDEKLTLEFSGDHPSFRRISVRPAAHNLPVIYLAGDSTVVDQDKEPWAAWGQMLPSFFGPGVVVANYAESGETIRSFETEQRFAKIFSLLKAGDYLFFQFAHNDQKPGNGFVSPDQYTALLSKYAAMAKRRGAYPVFVTSMNRRTFDEQGHVRNTLAPYPQLMRELALKEKVPLIDLNKMSSDLYEAVGEANSRSLFVYAEANTFPSQPAALHDDTHFNSYGAYELARCIVTGILDANLPLSKALRQPVVRFDPKRFDLPERLTFPPTPFVDAQKPYER